MHHTTKTVEQAQKDIAAQVTEASGRTALEARQQTLLQSLKYPGMNERRNHIKESHQDTFQWVLRPRSESASDQGDGESDDGRVIDIWGNDTLPFIEWAQSDQSSYWISGKPGSGKSTLMKFIIESPETQKALQSWRPGCMILSHYFWKPGSDLQRNIKGFWCSVAYQRLLAEDGQGLINYVLDNFPDTRSKSEHSDWSLKDVVDVCLATLGQQSNPLCVFIDGLDEINDDDGVTALKHVLSTLSEKASGAGLKFCLASRPEPRFRAWLNSLPELKLHKVTHRDMIQLVNDRLSAPLADWGSDEHTARQIKHLLVNKAHGVFLWLVLAIRSVIRGLDEVNSEAEIQMRIEHLPTDMEELYAEMWHRVNGSDDIYHETAAKIFNVVIFAGAHLPYTPILLGAMLATSSHHERLLSRNSSDLISVDLQAIDEQCRKTRYQVEIRCAGLLETRSNGKLDGSPLLDELVFIHRTAYDWLTTATRGRKLLGKYSSIGSFPKRDMLRPLFAIHWLFEVILDHHYGRHDDLSSPRFHSAFGILVFGTLHHGVKTASELWPFFLSLESRLESSAVTTPASRLAQGLCRLLQNCDSPVFHRRFRSRGIGPPLDLHNAILYVKIEAIKSLSAAETPPLVATVVLWEYLVFSDQRYSDTYPLIRLLLTQGADSNAVRPYEFMDISRQSIPEAPNRTMGNATEWLLHKILRGVVKLSMLKESRGTLEITQESFDILLLMINSEHDLARHSILGHRLDGRGFCTKADPFWRSYENGRWSYLRNAVGKACVIYKVTLAHLLFPLLYLVPSEERLPETSQRALRALRNLYTKCPVEPVRPVGVLIGNGDLVLNHKAYTMRETNPILPPTVAVEDFWRGVLASEMPDGQGGVIGLSDIWESLQKSLVDGELEELTGHKADLFAGEILGHTD